MDLAFLNLWLQNGFSFLYKTCFHQVILPFPPPSGRHTCLLWEQGFLPAGCLLVVVQIFGGQQKLHGAVKSNRML